MFPVRYFCVRGFASRYFAKVGSGAIVGVRAYSVTSFAVVNSASLALALVTNATATEE